MITGKDIEYARRLLADALNTPREEQCRRDLETLVAQAKREHRERVAS